MYPDGSVRAVWCLPLWQRRSVAHVQELEKKCMDNGCKCAVCSGLVARDVWMRKQATKTFVHLRPLNYSFLVTKVNQTENNSDDILIDLFRIGIFRHVIQFPPPQSTQLLCLFIPRSFVPYTLKERHCVLKEQ